MAGMYEKHAPVILREGLTLSELLIVQALDDLDISGAGQAIRKDGIDSFINIDVDATDKKVKYDAGDPTAGYIADKFVAGAGISLAEGTGANENKLLITNTDKGSDVDLSGLVPYTGATGDVNLGAFTLTATSVIETTPTLLKLDQTTPQTVINGLPTFNEGIITDLLKGKTDGDVTINLSPAENTIHMHPGNSTGDYYFVLYSSSDDSDNPQLYPNMDNSGQIGITTNRWKKIYSVDGDFEGNVTGANLNISNWDTAYGWGNHAGLYDTIGTASGLISTHESTYNHSLIATALQSESDPVFSAWLSATPPLYPGGWYDTLQGSVNISGFNNDSGFITGVAWDEITGTQTDISLSGFTDDLSYENPLTFSTGLSRVGDIVTCTITQYTDVAAIAAIQGDASWHATNWDTAYGWGNHASAGYITGNQTITLSGDVSGSGATSITVTIGADKVNDTHIDWGFGANQVSAVDLLISDAGGIITATDVEGALQENRTAINLNTAKVSADGSINTHSDVDTVSDAPAKNEVLKWNGTNWVPASYDYNFTFSIATFSDGETTTQLIGAGTWKSSSAMSCTATYVNGPPTTADILMSINGGAYNKVGEMTAPTYLTGTNSSGAISYPASKDQYLRFRLDADDGTDSSTSYDTAIYFRNYVKWGVTTETSGWDSTDINALANGSITNVQTGNFAGLNPGVGEYILFAFPSSYTSINATGFKYFTMTAGFEAAATVSVTNSAGYTENYKVYRSTVANLGSSTLSTATSSTLINEINYGPSTKASGYASSDVTGLSSGVVSNTLARSVGINAGASQYLVFAYPTRLGVLDYGSDYETDGGTDLIFNSISCAFTRETVSVTNDAGYTEDYYVYISTTTNLGNYTLTVNTTDQTINYLYYGVTSKTSSFTEADIEGLGNNSITNDNTQTWNSVTAGAGEYLLFSFPKRLGTVVFYVGGFEGGFESPETVSVTNSNGWTEDYYVWRSTNSGLGATIVTTQ